MEEHWKIKDGKFQGLYAVDPRVGRYADVWERLGAAIETYAKLHPLELAEALLDIEYTRQAQQNKFGSNKSKNLRLGLMIPPGLARMLEIVEPDIFENKKLFHKFMKKFPIFTVPQNV